MTDLRLAIWPDLSGRLNDRHGVRGCSTRSLAHWLTGSLSNRKSKIQNPKSASAFTLTELLVVMGIIALLAAAVIVGTIGLRTSAQTDATKALIAKLELAAQQYFNDYRTYPPDRFYVNNPLLDNTTYAAGDRRRYEPRYPYGVRPRDVTTSSGDITTATVEDLTSSHTLATDHLPNPYGCPSSPCPVSPPAWCEYPRGRHVAGNQTGHNCTATGEAIECLYYAVSAGRYGKPYLELKSTELGNADTDTFSASFPIAAPAIAANQPVLEIVDAWGLPLRYRHPGLNNRGGVDLWSCGPDRTDDNGGNDDVKNWK